LGDALVTGQIDLIKRLDQDGELSEVEVVDFKSDTTLLYKQDYDHELRLYVMACVRSLGLDLQRACIHDLESGEKRYVDIGERGMKVTEAELDRRIAGIRREHFNPTKSICRACDFTRICAHCRVA
jgi:CRISPR/Cas system-associated exonuclease Cas4 (RecB family)